ncbi:MAG: heterodisulfide reductase subunit C [Actinobacteria bacterium]|nr:heterodisulfide reductase subunit C [Actinomycetota bacterium]
MIRYDADQAAFYREKLVKRVQADVRDCYQCGNCTAGCPAAFTFDYTPNQVMRMLQVGLVDQVLDSKAVQLCIQCLTCTARCPRNIDIAGIFEDLKTIATAQERDLPEHVKTFNKTFLDAVARFGRLPEFYDMAMFYMGTLNPKMALGNVGLMVPVMTRRKMPLVPRRAKGADEVSRIYKKTMERARAREKAEAEARKKAAAEGAAAASKADAAQGAQAQSAAKSEVAK